MEDLYRKQNKLLKELYEGVNKELEILYKIIDISMSDEDYRKFRNQAEFMLESEED